MGMTEAKQSAGRMMVRCAGFALASSVALAMAGCSSGLSGTTGSTAPVVPHTLKGIAHGGQQPVQFATVTLWGVNSTTYQGASTSLATTTTDSGGNFNLTGSYAANCALAPGGDPYLYITVTGGDPGGGPNTNLALMAVLEDCNTLLTNAGSTFLWVNEITTVAGAYALGPFMGADYGHIGASSAYATGMANAFKVASSLVNFQTGLPSGPNLPGNATLPTAELYSLGNILASCVNGVTGNAQCGTLFTYVKPSGGSAPADTIMAAADLALNPGQNAALLYANNSQGVGAPWGGALPLSSAPQDWSIAIKYTDASLNAPTGIAFDASGNAWVANEAGTGVTELSATGNVLSTATTGFTGSGNVIGPQGIAIDRTGNVWVANTAGNSIVELTSGGAFTGNYTGSSISGPTSIAMDSGGNAWVANFDGASIVEVSSGGTPGSAITGTGNTISNPAGIAVDGSGNVWIANGGPSTMVKFNHSGTQQGAFTDNNLLAPVGTGIDSSNNVFVAANAINGVSGFNSSGSALVNSPASGGGLSSPTGLAVDGSANVWVTNLNTAGTLSKVVASSATALTPSTGLGSLNAPAGVAVDLSGNVWTANSGDNTISEFVGLGSPTVTPISLVAGP